LASPKALDSATAKEFLREAGVALERPFAAENPVPNSTRGMLSNGNFTISGIGATGQTCALLTASNLAPPVAWMPVLTNLANSSGVFSLTDPQATNFQRRFYRIRSP
jgi:hypothetical protein